MYTINVLRILKTVLFAFHKWPPIYGKKYKKIIKLPSNVFLKYTSS